MEEEHEADHPLLEYHYATRAGRARTCYPWKAFLLIFSCFIATLIVAGMLFVKPPHVLSIGVEKPSIVSFRPFVVNSTAYANVWNPNSFAVKIYEIDGNVFYNGTDAVGTVTYHGLEILQARKNSKVAANLLLDHFESSEVKSAIQDCMQTGILHTNFKGQARFGLVWKLETAVPLELFIDVACSSKVT